MNYHKLMVVVLFSILLLSSGCNANKTKQESLTLDDSAQPGISTNNQEMDTPLLSKVEPEEAFVPEDQVEWPAMIPSFVPRFSGNIVNTVESREGNLVSYTIVFEGIKKNDLNDFLQLLKESYHWEIDTHFPHLDGWTVRAHHEKQNAILHATMNDLNSGVIMITFDIE